MHTWRPFVVSLVVAAVLGCSSSDIADVVGVTTLSIYPSTDTLLVGATRTLSPTAEDINGDVVPNAAITYVSSSPAVATVDNQGVVTGVAVGSATITASSNGADATVTIVVTAAGRLSGRVYDAMTSAPIANATVNFAMSFGSRQAFGAVATHADGTFLSPQLNTTDEVTVTVAAPGYIGATIGAIYAPAGAIGQVEPLPLVRTSSGTGSIAGTVRDARTAQGIAGIRITLYHDHLAGNDPTVTSDANGAFQFTNLAPGTYTMWAIGNSSYESTLHEGVAIGNNTVTANQDLVMSPSGSRDVRIVLTWGLTPADLDAHLTGPSAGGSRFHVYYADRGSTSVAPFAGLDVDNTHSYGPETITITQFTAGTYRFSVQDFTNRDSSYTTALSTSGARVDVYYFVNGYQRQQSFYPPAVSGTLWTVFEMTGTGSGESITSVNNMGYNSNSSGVSLRAPGSTPTTDAATVWEALRQHSKQP